MSVNQNNALKFENILDFQKQYFFMNYVWYLFRLNSHSLQTPAFKQNPFIIKTSG